MTTLTLICLLTGMMLFAYWATYTMGSPLTDNPKDVDVGAIGHRLPHKLAIRRLKRVDRFCNSNVFDGLMKPHVEAMNMTKNPVTRAGLREDYKRDLITTGRKFFTWERSLLCPVCLHWWLTVLIIVLFLLTHYLLLAQLPLAGLIYLVNHFIIRKI